MQLFVTDLLTSNNEVGGCTFSFLSNNAKHKIRTTNQHGEIHQNFHWQQYGALFSVLGLSHGKAIELDGATKPQARGEQLITDNNRLVINDFMTDQCCLGQIKNEL